MKNFVFALMVLSIISCKSQIGTILKSGEEDSNEVFNGIYQSENYDCIMIITISDSTYTIKTPSQDKIGAIKIKKEGESFFFHFMNFYTKKHNNMTAEFISNTNTIVIQNYGNSMNEFRKFNECDSKYIELKKLN